MRIFTPVSELPFAGHPTLGTCHAWLEAGGQPRGEDIVQECGAGLVPIRRTRGRAGLRRSAADALRARRGGAWSSTSPTCCGIGREEILDAAWADNGPGWVAVLLRDAEAVLALRPGFVDLDVGVVGLHGDGSPELRAFFPKDGSTVEDPVTGSLNASVAMWLLEDGRLQAPYVARQGTALGRGGTRARHARRRRHDLGRRRHDHVRRRLAHCRIRNVSRA